MRLFADDLSRHGSQLAIIAQTGQTLTYAQLDQRVQSFAQQLQDSTGLILIQMANDIQPLVAYLAALRAKRPALLIAHDTTAIDHIIQQYQPTSHFAFQNNTWSLTHIPQNNPPAPHPDLALLLPTSGSTGAAKLVKLSAQNIQANADSIAQYLKLTPDDRAITSLPSHYSYGLSVIHSHLTVGATLLLTNQSVTDSTFWDFFKQQNATSLAGVPYTFELLDSIHFDEFNLPSLRYLTQAGGRLKPQSVTRYATLAQQKNFDFFVMYGQTEATARIAYIPPHQLLDNPNAIGQPIPNGALHLIDQNGDTLTAPNQTGELIYTGPNIMMGYAQNPHDLTKPSETTQLHTGDLAQQQPNGLFQIVGRKSRFLKIFGLRIALDEVEHFLAQQNIHATCTGDDQTLLIVTDQQQPTIDVVDAVAQWTQLPPHTLRTHHYTQLPRLTNGKIDYTTIKQQLLTDQNTTQPQNSITRIFQQYLGIDDIQPDDTFVSLGGDSLSYVQTSLAIEQTLGYTPDRWQENTVQQLEKLNPKSTTLKFIETTILLRALAIIFILSGHFKLLSLPGGAYALLTVAGFNFAKFQAGTVHAAQNARPIGALALRVLIPTLAYILLLQAVTQQFHWSITLMTSNLFDPEMANAIAPWFIQLLLQIFLLFAILFSFKKIRHVAYNTPYAFGLTLLAIAITTRHLGHNLWDTMPLYNRVPHMLLWMFALGWCIQFGQNTTQKIINTLALLTMAYSVNPQDAGIPIFTLAGLVLIWIKHVPCIWPLNKTLGLIGAASLYIYLTHFQFSSILTKLTSIESPTLHILFALVSGTIIWYVAEKTMTLLPKCLNRATPKYVTPKYVTLKTNTR